MEKRKIAGSELEVSRIGIGGHYRAMEEGEYENRYAYVDEEIENRVMITKKAIENGINYFDSTWRNEADLLGKTLEILDARDQVHVNGMILGAFSGSEATGMGVEEYFDKWLDRRLSVFPGNRFDSIMINAIDEKYDQKKCEKLVKLLDIRRSSGDFKTFGVSCHDPFHARKVADLFPEFQIIMVPYNFMNRKYETAFDGYKGTASIVAMKPLVWAEYGIPFCAVNMLTDFEKLLGFSPCQDAAARAIKFITKNQSITTAICAVNSLEELDILISAGKGAYSQEDEDVLNLYNKINESDKAVYLYISALMHNNLRMNYFGAVNLSNYLNVEMHVIPLNESDSYEKFKEFGNELINIFHDRNVPKI